MRNAHRDLANFHYESIAIRSCSGHNMILVKAGNEAAGETRRGKCREEREGAEEEEHGTQSKYAC